MGGRGMWAVGWQPRAQAGAAMAARWNAAVALANQHVSRATDRVQGQLHALLFGLAPDPAGDGVNAVTIKVEDVTAQGADEIVTTHRAAPALEKARNENALRSGQLHAPPCGIAQDPVALQKPPILRIPVGLYRRRRH